MNAIENLTVIDMRISDMRMYHPSNTAEMSRLQFARSDVVSNMSVEETCAYETTRSYVQSESDRNTEFAAMIKNINNNVDKPSI